VFLLTSDFASGPHIGNVEDLKLPMPVSYMKGFTSFTSLLSGVGGFDRICNIMEFSLSTPHYLNTTTPFSTLIHNQKHHSSFSPSSSATTSLSFSLKPTPPPLPNSENPTSSSPPSNQIRRPKTLKTTPSPSKPTSKIPSNPFRNLINPTHVPTAPIKSTTNINYHPFTDKLWLTSKLSPPPPPPPPPPQKENPEENRKPIKDAPRRIRICPKLSSSKRKNEVFDFFRQFGPIKNVILIKGHDSTERNAGFGFVIYGGSTAAKSAMKAVEFDGVEFHGRVLTVKLDDGRRLKEKTEERTRWIEGNDGVEYRSNWHKERDSSRKELRKIMDTEPENWQAIVGFFERIKKRRIWPDGEVLCKARGHACARETFESMRARGIEPTSHVYTSLIHAYAVGRDMEEALSCVRKMKEEGIEMSLVTYGIMVGGFAKVGNADQTCNMNRAEALVRDMEEAGIDAPIDIYHTMMDGYTMIGNEDKCLVVFERLKIGKVSKALEISKLMESASIKHNVKTYSMLINGFLKLKDWANAFAVVEDLVKDGLKPDIVLYNNIITAFCGMGNMNRAVRTVKEMQRERHRPTSRTFMPIIHGFARAGEMRRALEIFDMMRMSGCIPTVHTFNALVLGLVEKRQMEKAVEILDEMTLAGISPDEHTYTTIMHGYASLGDTGKAFEYFTKLRNEGLELDVYTYEALLKACCKAGRMQSALAVTKEMNAQKFEEHLCVQHIN
ncbi:pentatricopeptide repeat-containing protein, partial [Prunus dulcis]